MGRSSDAQGRRVHGSRVTHSAKLSADRRRAAIPKTHGMLSMAYLGRLLTGWVDQGQIRTYAVRFASITTVHAQPTCTGTVVAITEVDGENRADLALAVTLPDGTDTLTGTATIALPGPSPTDLTSSTRSLP